jgi:hypothetical protein
MEEKFNKIVSVLKKFNKFMPRRIKNLVHIKFSLLYPRIYIDELSGWALSHAF